MTLTDYTLKNKGPPEWIEEDQIVSVQGRVGEDIIVEMKLALSENYDDLRFELIKDGLPISTDRYQLSMRGNIVQLALNQSRKTDAGYYSLIATRLGQENNKGALKKIHLSISETSYEEGDPPVFLRRLSDLAVKVGTRTRFLIEIRSSTSLKITWYKDDTPIYDGARFSLVHEGNFHCVDVAPVRIEDQGCWTCMAENHSGRSSCTSTLTVIVPKAYKKPEFVEELRALLTETGTVSLECKVIGVPTPILRWFKDNKEIKAGDVFALTANPDDPTSLGVYTCEAVNCMGTAYSSSKVHVVGRGSREGSLKPADALTPSGPLPIFKQILQDECCRIGDTILLSCRVQVPPWPKAIAWYNKEGRIEPNEKYHVMEDGIGGYSIEIKQVEAMDEGEWKCVATSEDNMKQFTSCYVAMSIPRNYRKPRFMENLKAVLTEEGLVSFECKVVGFPTPLLRWFKDGQELKPGDVYQLTGTNSLGSYCCIARNCMGEAKSTAELTIEDIQNQLNEEERFQLLSTNQPPKFIKGLRSCEAKINEDFRFTVQVSVAPEPTLSWYRDDALMDDKSDKYHIAKENLGTCHFEVRKLEFVDQAEWKCVAANDFGHSVTSCFLKLIIPKHYKKPKFLESLRAILSEEGAVNLECKVIGVPQPVLKWYKDNVELKPGDIHRIITGQDGTCCLGIYTCEATNCMGTVSSSASLLGFENRKDAKEIQPLNGHELARNLSLSTIHEERTSQLYDTPQTDHSVTLDERGEVSFSFDGKEVSVSLYETPDLTEEEALQIVEMYADQLSEHVTEHNVIELPPMRFVKETSTTGNLLMEAVVIDVSPDYFVSAEDGDDLRTEADFEDVSIMDDVTHVLSSPERDSRSSLKRSARYNVDEDEKVPNRPPRKKSMNASLSKSERSQQIESESFHSAQKDDPPLSPLSSLKQDDSDTFADALSSAHLSITESLVQKNITSEHADNRKRSLSAGRSTGSSLDDGIGGDSSFDSMTGVPKKMQRKKKQRKDKSNSEKYSDSSDEQRKRSESEDNVNTKIKPVESVYETEMDNKNETEVVKELLFTKEKLDSQDNLKSVNEINSHVSKETKKSTEDILSEPRIALHKTLELFHEKLILNAHTAPLFSDIYEQIDNIYQILETSKGIGADIEILTNLEIPLHTLLKKINEIISVEYVEIIHDILQPSIVQLSNAIEKLESSSLQPTFVILKNFSKPMCNISSGSEKLSSTKSISDESQNISEEIVDSLLDIQSTFSEILQQMEQSKLSVNKSGKSQQISITSELMACLVELRECVSHTAHTAMALKENETLSSLMEFRKPLLDLQLILSANRGIFYELSAIKEINIAIAKLKSVIVTILNDSTNRDVIFQIKTIFKILEDTDKQILKLVEQSSEMKIVQKHMLKNLDIEQSLSKVHFALSSVLEKQHIASSHLITSIEVLRQTIGSSAVTIANLKNPVDNEITQEISTLNESLLNLQRDLLTEKHELEEEQILDNLVHPIGMLKAIIHNIIENSSSVQLILPMLELLEDIEKDIALVTKEISKRKYQEESITQSQKENTVEESNSKSILATLIRHSLDPIKNWLSVTSDDSTKNEMNSTLSSTIEELKRDITQIAIQTSYSEVPSDESLIKALIDLREPLMRLNTAISVVDYGPEDISVLENLNCPMKYLLQTIMSVLHERAQEKSLQPIINIIKQIENQIPLSIKDALYQQELKENAKALNIEMGQKEEETVTVSKETIPGTLTEVATIPLEIGSTTSFTEQATTENNFDRITDDIVQTIKNEKQEREKDAGKLIIILLETLEKLQLEITSILEDFEESTTQTTTIPQSKLANFLEDLRSIISTICMTPIHSEETSSLEEKFNQTTLVLINLMQPLTNIRNLLSRSHEHDVSELIILNRFSPLLDIIEINVIRQIINFVNKDEDVEKELEYLLCVLKEIKTEIPIVIQEISLRRKILEHLWDISKPLDSILERMSDLEKAAEETLETDVANILGKPISSLLKDIKIAIQEVDALDRREPLILELRNFIEPLLEFHSCLSMVQNSRKSLVPEASLLEERRSVILRAIDGLRKQVCHTAEIIVNMEDAFLFNESLTLLNSAILQVQKQVDKTDYSRRSSSTQISLQHRLTGTLSRLAKAIIALQEHTDEDTYGIVSKCLEALQKQISFSQTQFNQIDNELIDEEAIIEGFLYPANQLLSTLNILKENIQKQHLVISHSIVYFQELADSITELSFSLSAYKTELVREGTSEGAPIVETFSAVIDVLGHIKDSVTVIEKAVDNEQKASMIITKVESVTDEIIEVSQEEIENIMMITEIPSSKAIVQEAQLEIGGTPITTQISILENLETVQQTSVKQMKNNDLTDSRKYEENQKENERKEHLIAEISKFNCAINNLIQPLRELINLVKSTKQKSLVSKSEENKRKIQELTALIQVLNDLQATNASITTVISSSSVTLLDSQFSCMKAILSDLEQAVGTVISLTHEGVRPELMENIMTSLQFIGKPLDSLENILASIYQTIDKDRYIDKDRELSEVAQTLISCINDTVKSLNEMQISKCLSIVDDRENEMEISEVKEEMKNIEQITARPLEELIEAIMDSQEVKCDKTSESDLSSMNTIESKYIDNLKSVESQLNETLVKKMDDSAKRDEVETPQVTSLPESDQAEKLFIKNTGMIKTITQSLEKVEEQNLATIDKQEIEPTQISENNIILEKQIKVETLRTIISPLQVLRKSFDQIGEIGVFESSDKKTIAFSALIEPLLNLEFVLPEVTEDIKQNTVTLQALSVVSILDEVQRSVATIQEEMQLQLNAMAETSLNKTPKIPLAQAIMKPLGDLRISIARIQSDPMINQFVQQGSELSNVEQITILQNLVKSVTQFGERFTSIVNQIEIEATLPLQTIKQTDQQLDLELLHKIVNPIHVLRETLSQIENLNNYEAEVLEIPKQKTITTVIVQLTAVMNSLEKLEQSLIISTQQIIDMREKITKELNEDQNLLTSMNLKPILEELRNSITIVQEQIIFDEDIPALKTLTEALENLKMPLITVEEVIDHSDKVTEIEKIATLLSFAKSVENTTNQLMAIAKRDMAKQEVKEISLIKTMTIPIEELQSAILKLEDQVSQTLETKGSIKTVSFECMVQPLQELQQLFLTSSYQETALFLQELPLKPILDNLNKSVAVIQDQITLIQNVLIDGNTDDSIILKDFAKSLGNLRTSTVVLQQLNAIENAGQQIVEIENASALQAFAKSIEEFKKSCSVIVERPRIIEALTKNIELKQLNKIDARLIENIVAPLRILQEQILTIEESKMQESEILDLTEIRKPVTVLSSLVSPLQQLEKSFVATVQKQHVIEHDGHNLTIESSSVSLEKLALQPVLEEVQKSIATVQEHMILEAGKQITSEIESDTLLKSIAQPLVDLKASIASIQQVTAIAPDFLTELAQEQNVSTLETFAKILHNLTECMAMCNQQQVIMEPAADTISEDALSLNTWADVIDEAASKITHPMVIDQGVIESPTEIAMSMSEEEMSSLRTLAKPLTELRECLALIVEEQKTVSPCDTTCVLSEKENISLTKTMIQPLLELKQAAAIIIQEQMAIERTNEHSFVVDGKNEFTLRCLVEPLEELRHSIAIIQDQMLIETPTDQSKNDIILNALAEPLFDIQRAISILETRVISPDVESMSEDVGNNWITECLATPLHEIERSIAEIRQCDVMEPKTTIVEEKSKTLMPDRSIIEKLIKPVENIKSTISRMENDSTEIEVLKTIEKPLANVRENLMLLTDKYNLSAVEKKDVHAFIESLFNLEEHISFIKKEIIDKPMPKQSSTMKIDTTISIVNIPLTELKYSIAAIKDSPSLHLQNLERPLELVQNAFETIVSIQQNKKLSELSTKIINSISDISNSIESIENTLERQQISVVEIHIEYAALGILAKSLRNVKQCIIQIQEKPNTVNLMTHALESLEKSISLVQEQSADKPLVESQHTNFDILSKSLILCLHELQESIQITKTLWREETVLDGLIIFEKPISKLQTAIKIIYDQSLEETISKIDKFKRVSQKKFVKKEIYTSEIETNEKFIKKDNETNKIKEETGENKLIKDINSTIINDMKEKKNKKKLEKEEEEIEQEKVKDDKKSTELIHEEEEEVNKIKNKDEKQKREHVIEKIQKVNEKQENEEIEQIKKAAEQSKQAKDKIIEQSEKESKKVKKIDSFEKHKETGEMQEMKNQQEKMDTAESIKNIVEKSQQFIDVKEVKEEQNEQWNKKDYEETEKTECEEKRKEENVEKKKIAECKRIEMDQSIENKEKVESKEIKDSKNIDQSHEQYKQEENREKEIDRTQQEHQRERKVEMIQKEIDEFDNKVGITKIKRNEEHKNLKKDKKLEKEQENFEDEKCAVPLNQNKDVSKNEKSANQLKQEEEQKKGNKKERQEQKKQETKEKLKKKENKKMKSEKTEEVKNEKEKSSLKEDTVQEEIKEHKQEKIMEEVEKVIKQEKEQKKKETIEKIKEKENKKTNGQKIEELRKEKEDSNENKKQIQKKIEVQQKEVEDAKKQERELNNKETIEKVKEERDKTKRNEEIIKLEKEIKDTNKKEEKMKEEKQKKQDEDKILMNKENKESIKAEEIKIIKEEQTEIKRNIQEKEEKITQERDKVAEKVKEKEISKRKEEIDKTGEIIQQAQCEYVNGIKKRKYLQMDENKKKQNYKITMFQSQQEESKSKLEEKLETLEREEEEEQHKLQHDQSWSYTKKWVDKNSERWIQKDEDDRQERDNKKQHRMEMERLEKKRIMRWTKQEADYISVLDEENRQKRNEERKIRRDETTRLSWEEEQRLRKRQEEEIFRNRQRRKEQIKENEWSRKRENESDRFLRNMLETTYKSTPMFFNIDYSREYSSRFDSSVSILSSISRSYSWRDSLTSLSGKKVDDYWNYKLRSPVDKYYFDTSSSYRRRRKRENRMIRTRSTSLLKYEDYSTGDSDATIVPSTNIRSFRRTKAKTASRIDFDACESNLFSYTDLSQNKSFPWEKPKKPSFCTRLTNRIVGVGMRIRLTCTVLGNPEPRVYWTKDNQKLDASNKRCRMRYENGMAYLELDEALLEDAGIYTCVAENTHGTSITESILSVYSDYKPTHSSPIFVKSIKDTYRYSDRKLILECRVRSYPVPIISWLKDGVIIQGERYKQSYLDDDVYRLEIADPDLTDNGQYTCRAANELHTEEISHIVHVEDWRSVNRNGLRSDNETKSEVERKPRFSNLLKDYNVPAGGTIALQVEVKGVPAPEVKWLRGDRKEPITIPQARTFAERGLYTLIVPEATESERGIYVCRAINAYGQVDTSATVDVISSSTVDGGKPAVFVSRPSKKSIDVIVGEDISISFRVSGIPKPRITWMKGLTDITDGPRSYKESIDDYVRLTLKRVIPSDEGTYCILVKNRYGCDRSFFSIKIKQRARSLTPLSDWNSVTERDAEEYNNDMSYVRNVPGPISSEPVAIDGGKSWLSLSWGKAERRGPAPVIAYKVEAWLLGGDGGARWVELGITPINAFDAFNLRPGGEYKFRVTPRNRYGWGEPVTMTNSVMVSESTDLPEFTKILPGQLKALEGMPVKLECEIRSDSKVEVRWYRETMEINPCNNSRFAIHYNGSKYSLTIANIREDDSGRYVCEANNRMGKVSSFARILVVTDPRIIEADAKLKTSLSVEPEDRPPQFTMRIRDRRVQTTYPVRLTCQVIGHPIPEVTWYKNETEISQDERHVFWDDDSNFHTLEIIHSTLEDSGCYMVTARNINGSVSCRCNLVVDKGIRAYIAPEFLRDLNAVYTIPSGGELRMSAQLEAYPSVGVVWHRDGIRLRPSRRAVMTLSHDGTIQFSLANVTARDAGIYSCTATNVVGQTETSTRVAVITTDQNNSSIDESSNVTSIDIPYSKEPLFVTKPLSTEAIEGDTVIILCEVVGDPKPEVIWLRDFLKPDYYKDAPHFRLVGAGPQYRLEIPYAKLDFTGTYSVIARNCHGEAKAVISLQIYAKGQGKEEQTQKFPHGKILTLPIIKRELQDLRCCDGDAVSLECKVYATPEPPLVRWERGGKIITMMGDFAAEFNGETARLTIQHVYPEDEGEYTCVAYNDLGKAYTSACLVVDVPEGKENTLSQRLTRPMGLLSAGSTPRSTPRSTPIRSLSPAVSHGREFRSPQVLSRSDVSKRPKVCPPKFYAVPHNRLVQEGETVRFQCAVIGHPAPWVRWDKNGTVVTPSARISIKERDDIKILEIIDVMREDAAVYRVIAENDFGRIEASARLEVINRYETTSRTIRTRSASPRTHPIFDRSLLPTTSRINSRLQLECRVRGTPSVTPTWYRNGRPLERSSRIKRYFDGTTARMEISKIKASDAGEYTCIATNILGSTRSTCEVTVLDPYDPSFADKTTPQFLRSLPEESIVMENHCHEFQTGVIGTPPFTITWYKDGRELPDNDYYKYIVYEDGGVALRLSKVRPQDAGEYTCIVRNDFGIASCSNLFAVQDYKNVSKLALQFTKTPLSVTAAKGTIACFCARVQCGKTVDIIWTINGKDARESTKCKIERNSNVSILRIRDVSLRDTGVIRCTASINRKGPAISCIAKLQLQNSFYNLSNSMTKPEDIQTHAHTKLSLINTNLDMLEKITELSSLKCWRRREKSLTHIESSSFSRRAASYTKHVSPLPRRKQISNNVSNDTQKFRIEDDLSVQRIITKNLDTNLEFSKGQISLSSLNEEDINDTFIKLSSVKKTEELYHQDIDPISNNEHVESYLRGLTKATIIKEPTDISVIKGSAAVLRAIYQGCPEPTIKWFQVNRELRSGEKIGIVNRDGVSRLTLDDVTYDHAGKYEISVENSLGKDRRFFSLAVEGPPEPLADKPSVKLSDGQTTIVWRSPPYDGGRTLIGYTVEARRASESTWTVIAESCHSLSHTVATTEKNSVIPGESYYFRIRAENIHGLSDPSMESELVRILREGETMLQEEDEDKSEPSFEPRIVIPEEGKFFGEKYDVLEELGKGRYGVVKKVIERLTGVNFAAKFVRTIKTKDREQVREEIKIMNALRHPKLLLLVAAYEYPRETVLITEYISGGELFERVVADDFILTERDSILFMRQICQGVEYMHQNKIVHLDLKPENIMCCTRTSHQIKLIDFGLAQTLKSDTPIRVLFGTPEFIPPEIINYEPIGTESDMWSVGVICYVLLTGLSPFMGDNDAETFANITRADYDLEDKAFDAISNDAKNFISGLLIKRKDLRMSATQCLEHPWMVQHTAAMSRVVLPTEKLKKFIIRRKWQKTGNAIRALGRMAILSAYSRRSPTTTAESSPTLEQSLDNIEIQYSDGIESISNTTAVDIETENIEMSTKEDFTKIESQTNLHSTRVEVTEANVTIQKTSTKEKSNLNTLSKQINIEKEIPEMESGIESIPKIEDIPQNVTSHLEILVSNENKKSNEEIIDKFSKIEQYTIPKPQTFHRVFRGNSHDSGIDDCNSNLVTSPLQIDELGIVSTIKKEIDHETRTREGKQTLKKDENQRSLTAGILINLVQGKKTHLCDTEIIADNDKVAMTKSDMTKALCETNYIQKVADENADTRILSGHNRDKFLPTGNVSRTARIFETESATSNSNNSQVSVVQRAAIITGKPYNERIQKVFAFWNK